MKRGYHHCPRCGRETTLGLDPETGKTRRYCDGCSEPEGLCSCEPDFTDLAVKDILAEHVRALEIHGPHASLHEAYAVIAEELDELWDVVRSKTTGDQKARFRAAREEAVQIAAMALKLVEGIDRELNGGKGFR